MATSTPSPTTAPTTTTATTTYTATTITSDTTATADADALYRLGRWNFEESTGSVAADSSGDNFTGTLVGAPRHTLKSKVGLRALSFDATLFQYVAVTPLPLPSQFSVLAWLDTTAHLDVMSVFAVQAPTFSWEFMLVKGAPAVTWTNGNVVLTVSSNMSAEIVNDGMWHNVALVVDRVSIAMYIDGALEVSAPFSFPTATVPADCFIASSGSTSFFDGVLDDVRVYGGALTASEIVALVCTFNLC